MIKFNKNLSHLNYILSFDLAKMKTGWSFLDFQNMEVLATGVIDMSKSKDESFWFEYAERVREVVKRFALNEKYIGKVMITKEKCPSQGGRFSTIDTLQSLAKAHAIFDMVCYEKNCDIYDCDGVHSVSVKAYFKKLTGLEKPTKQDIAKCLYEKFSYNFPNNLDITDSLAVSLTLLNVKWNNDIKDEVKKLKKQSKEFKTEIKKQEIEQKIAHLNSLVTTAVY